MELSDRIKKYEKCFDQELPIRMPIIIRLDGKNFHTMVKKWKCKKPYDDNLIYAMNSTANYLCENIPGCLFGYKQSDEISLVLKNDQTLETEPWFNNRVQKIVSIAASMATVFFNYTMGKNTFEKMAVFDGRVFVLPNDCEVVNYLIWRQKDAERNSIQMLAQSLYSHKELKGKKSKALLQMCEDKGFDWESLKPAYQRGVALHKESVKFENYERMKWVINLNTPVFVLNRDYIYEKIKSGV